MRDEGRAVQHGTIGFLSHIWRKRNAEASRRPQAAFPPLPSSPPGPLDNAMVNMFFI